MNSLEERIKKADKIAGSINGTLKDAIAINAFYRRSHFRKDLTKAVDKTYEAHGVTITRQALLVQLALEIGCLMDVDNRSGSIVVLFEILRDVTIQEQLTARAYTRQDLGRHRRFDTLPYQGNEALYNRMDQAQDVSIKARVVADLEKLHLGIEKFDRLRNTKRMKRILNLRNKVFAHRNLSMTNHGARFGDPPYLLKILIDIFQTAAIFQNGHNYSYDTTQKIYDSYANIFWTSLIKGSKIPRKVTIPHL